MTIVVLEYETATVYYHTLPIYYLSPSQIEDYLYYDLGYSCNNINWMVTKPITCKSCRHSTQIQEFSSFKQQYVLVDWYTCHKGTYIKSDNHMNPPTFGCNQHQQKDLT